MSRWTSSHLLPQASNTPLSVASASSDTPAETLLALLLLLLPLFPLRVTPAQKQRLSVSPGTGGRGRYQPTCGGERRLSGAVSVDLLQLVRGGGAQRVQQALPPQPFQQAAARLLHVLLCHLGQGAVLGGRVVRSVHGGAGRRQGRQRGPGGQGGQGLRGIMGAFGFTLVQRVRGEQAAVSGHCFWGEEVTEVGIQRFRGALVAFVLGDAVDVSETDGAEGAAAGGEGAAAGGQGAPAAAGGHGQGAGRQAADTQDRRRRQQSQPGAFL